MGYLIKTNPIDPIETKRYKVIPKTNRFIPDILKNGRIQYPGIYELNIREVRRCQAYGYVIEEITEPLPDTPEILQDIPKINSARLNYAKVVSVKGVNNNG